MAVEGVDGCGKTTQAKMLVERLRKEGYKAVYVQPVFILLNVLTRSKGNDVTPISPRKTRTSQMSNSDKHRKTFFSKKLFMGLLGYPYALITYLFMKVYLSRNKIVKFFPKADVTFFLDGNLDLFYSRMDNSFDASVSRDYYTDVLNLYRRISRKYGFIQVDANFNKEAINDLMFMHLTKEMKGEML